MGLGATALHSLLTRSAAGAAPSGPHFPPRARQVIFLFMAGAPSQLDLFDYKPRLHEQFNKPLPKEVSRGQRVTAMTRGREQIVAPSMFRFARRGRCGVYMSELLPHLSTMVDELCIIKSTHTDAINHDPGKTALCTGSEIPGKASLGAWLSYGLGSLNRNLPDFVVVNSAFWTGGTVNVQALYSRLWGAGFLPSRHQGVSLQTTGDPVLFLSNPKGVSRESRRRMLDLVSALNRKHEAEIGDPETATTIAQQEMAFRMQASVPELTDLSGEPERILEMYGPEVHKSGSFARNCLLARRMIERGVRFVQLFHRGWDHHANLPRKLRGQAYDVDQPSAALLKDLKQRGLLDETLVVFGGEFGRTTYCQGKLSAGRLRPRPPPALLLHLDGRRRHPRRDDLRADRRVQLQHRREPRPRARPQRHDPPPARPRPRPPDVPPPRTRAAAHRGRGSPRGARHPRLTASIVPTDPRVTRRSPAPG